MKLTFKNVSLAQPSDVHLSYHSLVIRDFVVVSTQVLSVMFVPLLDLTNKDISYSPSAKKVIVLFQEISQNSSLNQSVGSKLLSLLLQLPQSPIRFKKTLLKISIK